MNNAFNDNRLDHLQRCSPEQMLRELLAVIHRDGGHYSIEHGLAKAVFDAEKIWYSHRGLVEALKEIHEVVSPPGVPNVHWIRERARKALAEVGEE